MAPAEQAQKLVELLGLPAPPIALAFRQQAPEGLARADRAAASGCSYWQLAADGRAFYTEAADHYNCPIGAYTHNVALPAAQQQEFEGLIGTMLDLQYLRQEELPQIPRRNEPFQVALYGPLATAPFDADLVLIRANAVQMMLLSEAAGAAGVAAESGLMGRPTCAMIPVALQTGKAPASLGCVGNRVYTSLANDEVYYAIPGDKLATVVDQLGPIVGANRTLEEFHRARQRTIQAGAV